MSSTAPSTARSTSAALLRLTFPVPLELADALGACLFEAGAAGLEEAPGALVTYVPDRDAAAPLLEAFADFRERVLTLMPDAELGEPELSETNDEWQRAWLDALGPEPLGEDLVLRPTTHAPAPDGERTLWFEPTASFGAGGHATTRLAAAALSAICRATPGLRMFDVGVGNGVLTFVALVEGAHSALAVDIDPVAVDALAVNARLNQLGERIEARVGSANATQDTFPLVVANIDTRTLGSLCAALSERVAPGGRLLLTGLLAEDADELASSYAARGLGELERHELGGWALLILGRAA
ncbi:MAG TPA: 50S ribosomal protein L11 methyltransferase [Polyangiaceae bacterium]|nr:50S ribosomal protein L11 methyltransferase [Polyangiaceae bacterium]